MKNTKNYMKLARVVTIALLICTIFIAAACGNTVNPTQTEPSESAQSSAAVSGAVEKQQGGDLFIAMPENISSLDPLTATNEDLVNLLTLIYEPAVRIDDKGQPQSCLVESWEVSQNGQEYTFKIRNGVTFADGTPLTAADVVYSANRLASVTNIPFSQPTEASEGPEATEAEESATVSIPPEEETANGESAENVNVEDQEQVNHYARYNALVSSIEAVDESTVKLFMTKPGAEALYFMAFPVMNEAANAQGQTVGTGPYKIEAFNPSSEMVLVVNDAWWGGVPNIPKIVAKPMTGNTAKLEAVSTSILDFITTDVLYSGKYKISSKTQVTDYITNYYDCLVPNLDRSALGITDVRKALSYAIDRREIISTVLLNHAVPANLPIAPDFYAYDAKYKQDDDIKMAQELLKQAGYRTSMEDTEGSTLQFSLIVPDDREMSYRMEAAKAIAKQLEKVGILVTVETLVQEEYMQRLQNKNFDLALCSFYMNEDPDLGFMLNAGGAANYGGVNSQEIANAIDAARNAFTEKDIKNAYSELQRELVERVPQIGLYYRMNSAVCSDLLKDLTGMRQGQVFAHIDEWYYQKS